MKKIVCSPFKNIFLTLFFTFIGISSYAQNTSVSNDFWNKVRFGGGIGLGFGDNFFNGSLSPSAIYQANDKFAFGLSLNLSYSKFNESKLLAYGGSFDTFYNPIEYIQLSSELQQLRINREIDLVDNTLKDKYWSPALFLGIGYTQRNFTFGVKYDVLHDENKSLYADTLIPFVRVYF